MQMQQYNPIWIVTLNIAKTATMIAWMQQTLKHQIGNASFEQLEIALVSKKLRMMLLRNALSAS